MPPIILLGFVVGSPPLRWIFEGAGWCFHRRKPIGVGLGLFGVLIVLIALAGYLAGEPPPC